MGDGLSVSECVEDGGEERVGSEMGETKEMGTYSGEDMFCLIWQFCNGGVG